MTGVEYDLRASSVVVGAIVKPAGAARIARKASVATVSGRVCIVVGRGVSGVGANPADVVVEARCIGTVLDDDLQSC